jgi:hypothetical protein
VSSWRTSAYAIEHFGSLSLPLSHLELCHWLPYARPFLGSQSRSREMVEWLTPKVRPISVKASPASRLAIASLLLLVGRDWCLARFLQNSSIRTYQEEGVANLWER